LIADKLDPRRFGAEADELRVIAAARRKALRPDVKRLEEIRLAGSVLPDREDEPRLELQLERSVGAVVAERDVPNDQPVRGAACGAGVRTRGPSPFVRRG
jgi:hypothetical protein